MKLKPSTGLEEQKMEQEVCNIVGKKKRQRTNCRRRVRSPISPILLSCLDSSHTHDAEVCCDSLSRVSAESSLKKRKLTEVEEPFRRITRSYAKKMEKENCKGNEVVEVSESSCVESNSGVRCVDLRNEEKKNSKLKEINLNETFSESICRPGVCGGKMKEISYEILDNDAVSLSSSVVESCSRNRAETELSDISKNESVAAAKQSDNLHSLEAGDLACTESYACDEAVSNYSSSLSDFLEQENSSEEFDCFSDYSPSFFSEDSGSQFTGDDESSPASNTYSLLLAFRKQFSRSTSTPTKTTLPLNLEASTFMRFEEEEEQESYERLLERERRQIFLHDYTEFYASNTEYGDLIRKQRSQMVHWIVEQSTAKEFQLETMFLGVSLLDRFLGKGFFKTKRNLQIVGIACLALATRIEENQPYNSVRQRNFYIGSNEYSRCEVVAMEWLVQEVLNFQCFLPTIHNFLWFYLKAARADAKMEKRAKYLAVLTLSDHEQLGYWPSTVAAGLVILATLESNQIASYQRVIQVHLRTKEDDLHECVKSLEWLLQFMS